MHRASARGITGTELSSPMALAGICARLDPGEEGLQQDQVRLVHVEVIGLERQQRTQLDESDSGRWRCPAIERRDKLEMLPKLEGQPRG